MKGDPCSPCWSSRNLSGHNRSALLQSIQYFRNLIPTSDLNICDGHITVNQRVLIYPANFDLAVSSLRLSLVNLYPPSLHVTFTSDFLEISPTDLQIVLYMYIYGILNI